VADSLQTPGGSKPPSRREDALAIVKRLREQGHVAYFAGGCVRDALLELEPKDYDVATDAPPGRVRELFSNTQAVGAAFGVILVRHGKSVVEVATFRTDVSYEDGRRPTAVKFTTAQEDAKRRDFTINGLFFDPIEGRVIDYVGGQEDLKNRILRAIGNPEKRFAEDYLRLLRAVRFAARFQLSFDPPTALAIKHHAHKLRMISPERVGEELRLMLTGPRRAAAWGNLWEFSLIHEIFRFVGEDRPPPHHESSFIRMSDAPTIPFSLALAAALLDYRRAMNVAWDQLTPQAIQSDLRGVRKAIRTTNEEHDEAAEILTSLSIITRNVDNLTIAIKKRLLAKPTSGGMRAILRTLEQRYASLEAEFEELSKGDVAPPPLLSGDDLTVAGWAPGPVFKRVLDAVYDAQLEDGIKSKKEALRLAEELREREK
jgi:poly(A) polymerase